MVSLLHFARLAFDLSRLRLRFARLDLDDFFFFKET